MSQYLMAVLISSLSLVPSSASSPESQPIGHPTLYSTHIKYKNIIIKQTGNNSERQGRNPNVICCQPSSQRYGGEPNLFKARYEMPPPFHSFTRPSPIRLLVNSTYCVINLIWGMGASCNIVNGISLQSDNGSRPPVSPICNHLAQI